MLVARKIVGNLYTCEASKFTHFMCYVPTWIAYDMNIYHRPWYVLELESEHEHEIQLNEKCRGKKKENENRVVELNEEL